MSSSRNIDAIVPFVGYNKVSRLPLSIQVPDIPILPTIAGTAAFAATLSLSTYLQSLLKISTGTPRPIPSIFGVGAVAVASLVCHYVTIETYHQTQSFNGSLLFDMDLNLNSLSDASLSFVNNAPLRIRAVTSSMNNHHPIPIPNLFDLDVDIGHTIRIILVGLIAYKGLGGRFWSISPSSYTNLGSFARRIYSLPATDAYATRPERSMIKKFGRLAGCHTCGDRMIGKQGLAGRSGTKFVADHMPPRSASRQMNQRWYRKIFGKHVKQRFYPQCVECSYKQSNFLSDASRKIERAKRTGYMLRRMPNLSDSGGGGHAYVHSLRPRAEHIAGGILASATVADSDDMDIFTGNRIRFHNWQLKAEERFFKFLHHISRVKKKKKKRAFL